MGKILQTHKKIVSVNMLLRRRWWLLWVADLCIYNNATLCVYVHLAFSAHFSASKQTPQGDHKARHDQPAGWRNTA